MEARPDLVCARHRIRSVYVSEQPRLCASLIPLSQVHMEQGLNRRAHVESALHRSVSRICQPRFQQIPREMGVGPSELRLRLPQVRRPLRQHTDVLFKY